MQDFDFWFWEPLEVYFKNMRVLRIAPDFLFKSACFYVVKWVKHTHLLGTPEYVDDETLKKVRRSASSRLISN